jgi:Domain of Unknown Function (DUF748)
VSRLRVITAPLLALVRLHWIALCVVAGLVLLYTLAGFFLVPYLARSQAESYITDTLHRQVSIGAIRFNPFFLDASVSDFSLKEGDGSPLVSFRHLYVNAEIASLWRRAVVLKEVALSAPNIELVVERDGSVNLAKLVPPSPEPPPAEPEPLPRVHIGALSVAEGRIGFADHARARPFTATVKPIRFALNDFKTDVGHNNPYQFNGTTNSGEHLEWAGGFTVQPLGSTGRFRVDGLKMATIDSYAAESLQYRLASGTAALHGSYEFALSPALALNVTLPVIQISDLSLAERTAAATVPVILPKVDVEELAFSYGKEQVTVKRIQVSGAKIAAIQEADGSINLNRLFSETAAPASQAPDSTTPMADTSAGQPPAASDASSSWRISAGTVQMSDAAIVAEDRTVSPNTRFELTPVQLTVDNWSTDADAKMQIDADVTINKSGRLLSKGDLQLEPLNTQLTVELKDFDLPVMQPYITHAADLTLHSGQLGVKGDLTYSATPETATPITFNGDVRVANLRTTDKLVNEDFVKWRDLAVSGIDFSLNPDKLNIERIVARQPYARFVIAEDTSLNVTQVLRMQSDEPEADATGEDASARKESKSERAAAGKKSRKAEQKVAQTPTKTSGSPTFPSRIRSIQFIDGSANFADYSIEPDFATGILELNGTVTGLSSDPASRAKVKLDGKVDKYAPVDITGEVNLLSATAYTDLAMNFRNMELTTFNPYSGKFAGYNISKGKLSTELHYLVQDRKLDAKHHIIVDNLEFGAKTDSKDAAPIPLKLAIALLKDRSGIIDVSLPVTGTLDDPEFRLGPIIWKAILGLLTKIVTAPFAALGALFGAGEELAYIDFSPGSAALPPEAAQKLNTVAKALIERPQLRLSVPLTVVAAADTEALANAALAAKLPPDAAGEPQDDGAKRKRIAALEKTYEETAGAAPAYPAEIKTGKDGDLDAQLQFLERSLLEQVKPDDAALTTLARERARAVQDALLTDTGLDFERVFITAERKEGKNEGNLVRMEMTLE